MSDLNHNNQVNRISLKDVKPGSGPQNISFTKVLLARNEQTKIVFNHSLDSHNTGDSNGQRRNTFWRQAIIHYFWERECST